MSQILHSTCIIVKAMKAIVFKYNNNHNLDFIFYNREREKKRKRTNNCNANEYTTLNTIILLCHK